MKKKLFAVLLATTMLISLTGCRSSEENIADTIALENEAVTSEESSESQNEEIDETAPEEPIKFDCLDEIKNASPDSGLIQIDDMIFQYGAKFSEILEVIAQSECTYTCDYNEKQLVPEGEVEKLFFKKQGETYFSVRLKNFEAETIELKDCIADVITAEKASKGNAYYAGFNEDDLTYYSVKESMGNFEPEKERTDYDARQNERLEVLYIVSSDNIDGIIPGENKLYIYYIFDSDTNELNSFLICDYKYSDSALPW